MLAVGWREPLLVAASTYSGQLGDQYETVARAPK